MLARNMCRHLVNRLNRKPANQREVSEHSEKEENKQQTQRGCQEGMAHAEKVKMGSGVKPSCCGTDFL